MKLQDLLLERAPLTDREFEALPAISASNVDDRYKVGKIAFDNEHGMGAVPNNANVEYLGFVVMITPETFLELAAPGNRKDKARELLPMLRSHTPIGTPFLNIRYNDKQFSEGEPLRVEIVGHEGRARVTAIQLLQGSATKIPVHIIPRGEVRARHFSEKFFSELRQNGMVPERLGAKASPIPVHFGQIFWMGKAL